ncbi:conjugal transfer family protein [Neorickettsia helminthoeca str. Oregon]|uniref:Conjugal transfer family protein n=1 Tax=Neorickettsia helminthoeca str. Oregon TaxID=1286528 RepID=X5GX64_9RICK|nr:TrbG/VirB9 family P-type conjugative transfer protein [Neorickettsia helminthoeca]AHX11637.1 conjugal transfer family protein [Neorickettsia helminthoeca str. Oregon]
MIARKVFSVMLLLLSSASANDSSLSDDRIKTLVYSRDAIFRIDTGYGYQSFIEFSDKEKVKTIAIGGSVGWNMNPIGNKIFLRPLEKGLSTNMVVVTDRHTYVFDLFSDSDDHLEETKKSNQVNYVVRFYYPDEVADSNKENPKEGLSLNGKLYDFSYDVLRRNYSVQGKAEFEIAEIMNNTNLTFFKFKGDKIPRVFVVNPDRSETQAKMWKFKEYVVIEGVHKKLHLRYRSSVLEVVNNDLE